jgi:hypothetical protein
MYKVCCGVDVHKKLVVACLNKSGKRYSGRIRKGNTALKVSLIQAAHAAVKQKNTFFSAQYQRISHVAAKSAQ